MLNKYAARSIRYVCSSLGYLFYIHFIFISRFGALNILEDIIYNEQGGYMNFFTK